MSDAFNLNIGGLPDVGFTIKLISGCRVVFGLIPASEFGMLTHGFSKKALIAPDIADRIGATCVIGEPADLDELRKRDLPVSAKRQSDYLAAYQLGLFRVANWLRTGERGESSNAMSKRIFGVPADANASHPRDPDDLRRCLLFLDVTQANDQVPMMADVSPEWGRLVLQWDVLVGTYREETRTGKSTPKTYTLMLDILR